MTEPLCSGPNTDAVDVSRSAPELTLSVVIPTIGRTDELRNTVDDLCEQKLSRFEIVIVTQGSERLVKISEMLRSRQLTGACFLNHEPNASLARNIGLLESTGDIVLFLDDDLEIQNPDFLVTI